MRRVKIVATIGPASDSDETLDALVAAGLDVARLNASHSDRGELERRFAAVRAAAERAGRHVGVMLDLGGPKLRVCEMAPGTVLADGSSFDLVAGDCVGDATRACVNHAGLADDLEAGDLVLLADAMLRLRVTGTGPGRVTTTVESGGALTSRKGVNIPGRTLSVEPITAKDAADLEWGLGAGIDLVAQSFVRSAEDVDALRARMGERGVPIVAKVEKHEAISHLPEIIEAADAVMVARGDLGAETSPESVPVIQRRLVRACRVAGRPVVVATEMLESMIRVPRPTRAEATDVASAVFQRADAVMLSAETAIGAYPVEAVTALARITEAAEEAIEPEERPRPMTSEGWDVTRAVSGAVVALAEEVHIAALVTTTQSGATARAVSRHRPGVPIAAVTSSPEVARRLSIVWGVEALVVPEQGSMEATFATAMDAVRAAGLAHPGDLVAVTAGLAVGVAGSTDTIQVRRV